MKKARRIMACVLALVLTLTVVTQTVPVHADATIEVAGGVYDATAVSELNAEIAGSTGNVIVKLKGDIDITERIVFGNGANFTLDLNGYTITGIADTNMNSVIKVENTTLTLIDSKGNAGTSSFDYNIVNEDTTVSKKTYKGGGITIREGNTANHIVYVANGATFNMEGGAIYGGHSAVDANGTGGNGAGIEAANSTVNLYSGVIANNYAEGFGGGVSLEHTNLTISKKNSLPSVIISGNTADKRGGGIYAYNGNGIKGAVENGRKGDPGYACTVTINDPNCYITDNKVYTAGGGHLDNGGGGLRLDDDTIFVMNGGYITGNTSGAGGGGVMAGYYNTTGWYDGGQSYQYIAEVDRVSITINGGHISANTSNREGAGVFIGGNCSAEVTGADYTYIKNNTVVLNTTDWGGAGLFVGAASAGAEGALNDAGLGDYTGPGSLHIQKAIITDNTAWGFGGGVAGCATARVFINTEEIGTESTGNAGEVINKEEISNDGVAIYDNIAKAVHDDNYHPIIQGATDHLSGTTSAKNEDRVHTNGNRVFWDSGYQDYFCALNTQIGNTMLGGGSENWIGSADSVYAERGINYTAEDQNIYASYLTGLTARTSEADEENAEAVATVEISGNESGTHGGGILANGVLVLGDIPETLEVQDRIIIDATKAVMDRDGTNYLNHPAEGFVFDVFQYDGKKTAEMRSVTSTTNAALGEMNMTFAYNGGTEREPWTEYTYFIAERGNEDDEYSADRAVYYIWLKGIRDTETAGDAFGDEGDELDIAKIQQVRIIRKMISPDELSYDADGVPRLETPIATGVDSSTLSPEEAAKNDAESDRLWRAWQKSYLAHVDAEGNFLATCHGETHATCDYQTEPVMITNDDVTIVVDYDINHPDAAIFACNTDEDTTNDISDIREIIDLNTGTDHAKILHLDVALGKEVFVNKENLTDVSVTKKWVDTEGNELTDAPAVTFELYSSLTKHGDTADTSTGKTITLDGVVDDIETTAWKAEFKNLPKTDKEGYTYTYYVKEIAADGTDGSIPYTPSYEGQKDYALDGETITNTFVQENVTVTVEKVWDDDGNRDAVRPNTITVQLYKNGEAVSEENGGIKTVSEENGTWSCTFEGLDKYNSKGKAYFYTVAEEAVPGYSTKITSGTAAETNTQSYIITNSYTPEKTSVQVTKLWIDGSNKDNTRPDSIELTLYQTVNGTTTPVGGVTPTVEKQGNTWIYTYANLPEKDSGVVITYSISEKAVDGYISDTPREQGTNNFYITNMQKVSVSASKEWINADGTTTAPSGSSATFTLYADGVATGQPVVLNGEIDENGESAAWTATFNDLPKYRTGGMTEVVYTIKETTGWSGYEAENDTAVAGGTITNRQETVSVSASKAWKDVTGGTEAPLGATVTFELYADGQSTGKTIELNGTANYLGESVAWTATFDNLPKYQANGTTEINYTVKEAINWPGYVANKAVAANGETITNTQATVDISVSKAWKNADNTTTAPEGAAVTFELYADGAPTGRTIKLDGTVDQSGESTAWEASFKGLAKYQTDGTTEINYTVRETKGWTGYEPVNAVAVNGETITNERILDEAAGIELKLNKVDQNNTPVKGASFELRKGDEVIASASSNENGDVTLTVAGEDLWKDQTARTLTLIETAPNGYTGAGPWTVTIESDGTENKTVEGAKVTVYKWKITGISDGETALSESKGVYTVTNNKNTGNGIVDDTIKVYKVDADGDSIYGAEFTLYDGNKALYVYSAEYGVATISTSDDCLKDVLPAAGESKELTLKETKAPAGYKLTGETWDVVISTTETAPELDENQNEFVTTTVHTLTVDEADTLTVTNNKIKTSVSGTVTWIDEDNAYNTRPEKVTVRLYVDNKSTDITAVVSEETDWKYEFTNLDEYADDGTKIEYTVYEEDVADGYVVTYDDLHLNITNTYDIEHTSVTALKVWDDAGNQDGIRPTSIQVQLMADNDAVGEPVVLNEANNWRYVWNDLDAWRVGSTDSIVYSVKELGTVDGYEQSVSGKGNVFTITNRHVPETIDISITMKWEDENDSNDIRPSADEVKNMVYLVIDDVEIAGYIPDVTDREDGTYTITYTNLPKKINGVLIEYSIREDIPKGYEADSIIATSGGTIINRYETSSTSSVNTADYSNVTTYAWICGGALILAIALMLFGRTDKKDRFSKS